MSNEWVKVDSVCIRHVDSGRLFRWSIRPNSGDGTMVDLSGWWISTDTPRYSAASRNTRNALRRLIGPPPWRQDHGRLGFMAEMADDMDRFDRG